MKTEKTDWRRHQHAVDKNNEFVAKYNAIYVKIAQAVSECADKINKTDSTVCIPAPPAPTLEELEQMGPMPWGAPGERQAKNCADSFNMGASRFLQEAWDGTKRLAGFDEHGWSIGNTWNTIWSGAVGITDLGTSLVVSVIATPFIVWGGYKPSEWERERLEVFTRAGSDMVGFDLDAHWAGKDGWHKWTNDPIATGTELGLGFFGKAAALKTLGKLGLLPKIPHPATYLRNQIPRFTTGLKNFNASLKDWTNSVRRPTTWPTRSARDTVANPPTPARPAMGAGESPTISTSSITPRIPHPAPASAPRTQPNHVEPSTILTQTLAIIRLTAPTETTPRPQTRHQVAHPTICPRERILTTIPTAYRTRIPTWATNGPATQDPDSTSREPRPREIPMAAPGNGRPATAGCPRQPPSTRSTSLGSITP